MYWTTKTGEKIPYKKLEDSHLLNILQWVKSKADTGFLLESGGGGHNADDIWYDSKWIEGQKVLDYYNYKELLKEAKRRKLTCQHT
jgi:hypothetical protein